MKASMKAIIHSILEGKHGPYAVATADALVGSVTVSLDSQCWKEKEMPVPGSVVFLMGINQKRAGWRADEGRFWRPTDEQQRAIVVRSNDFVEFVRLSTRQFPHFEICEQIVLRAEERNWNIPGMEFIFDEQGSGEKKYRFLTTIRGKDFKISFHLNRDEHRKLIPSEIIVPCLQLRVFEEECGPTLYWYVGKDWEKDREWFIDDIKIHSRLDNKPRRYLRYESEYRYGRPEFLVPNDDLGREYSPEGDDPKQILLDDVFKKIVTWLDENVLGSIQMVPPAIAKTPFFIPETKIPWPEKIGPLFTYVDKRSIQRIALGQENPLELKPEDRFALRMGLRLVALDVNNDGTIPEVAYEGFIWCGFGQAQKGMTLCTEFDIPGLYGSSLEYVLAVKPKFANHIYVADMSIMEIFKAKWFVEHPDVNRLTNEAYDEYRRIPGRTLIPIEKYDGSYKKPVVLINRELALDEVELV